MKLSLKSPQVPLGFISKDNVCELHWDQACKGCIGGCKHAASPSLEIPGCQAGVILRRSTVLTINLPCAALYISLMALLSSQIRMAQINLMLASSSGYASSTQRLSGKVAQSASRATSSPSSETEQEALALRTCMPHPLNLPCSIVTLGTYHILQ